MGSTCLIIMTVEAYIASWIEMVILKDGRRAAIVEAYIASWIEISLSGF